MTLNYLRGLEELCMQLNQQKPANHLAAYCKTANKVKAVRSNLNSALNRKSYTLRSLSRF